jgi:DNA-binding transcriptional LysR family regulator
LEEGQIDAAVTSARLPPRRFAFEELHQERYYMVGTQGIRSLTTLAKHLLVDCDPSLPLTRYWLDASSDNANFEFREVRYLGTIAAVREFLLRDKQAVAVLPAYFVENDIRKGRLKRLFPKARLLSDHFRLVYRHNRNDAYVIQQVAAEMRARPLR